MTSPKRNPVALVTGGTTGIGLVTCQNLVARGIDVILTSRSDTKGNEAVSNIQNHATDGATVRYIIMELSDLSSVSKACEEFLKEESYLDYLLLNAGLMADPTKSEIQKSADDIEFITAVNHVAGYFIAHKLLPLMETTAKKSPLSDVTPMITFVSSDLHNIHSPTGAAKKIGPIVKDDVVRFCSTQGILGVDGTAARESTEYSLPFHPTWMYKFSKLLNVLTATAISKKLSQNKSTVQSNSMEPGFIPQSDLSRTGKEKLGETMTKVLLYLLYHGPFNWLVSYVVGQPIRTLKEGAESEIFALTQGKTGMYYRLDEEDPPSPLASDMDVVEGFYQSTSKLLQEKGFPVTVLS